MNFYEKLTTFSIFFYLEENRILPIPGITSGNGILGNPLNIVGGLTNGLTNGKLQIILMKFLFNFYTNKCFLF